jgi:hypothetical protein
MRRLRIPTLAAVVLAAGPARAFDMGFSYGSEWGIVRAKSGVDVAGSDASAAPDYRGSLRTNVVSVFDSSGWLRAGAIAVGSAAEEQTRRENEAEATGGTYHVRSIGVPDAVPGGVTRVSIGWGRSDDWRIRYLAYQDSVRPWRIGDSGVYWSIEAQVVMGTLQNAAWDGSDFIFSVQVGPVFGASLGGLGPLRLAGRIGARIDPIFKPIGGLVMGSVPMLDGIVYAQLDAIAWRLLTLGGRVAYARGFMLTPSSNASATLTVGLTF